MEGPAAFVACGGNWRKSFVQEEEVVVMAVVIGRAVWVRWVP